MKPAPFDYVAPDSLDAALRALAERPDDAKLLAGGQSLIPVLNFRLARPSLVIDLNRVPGLDSIEVDAEGGLSIGALTRQSQLERHPDLSRLTPVLAEAMPWIAHPQIRNRGTIGGSLAHADPAAELPAVMLVLEAQFRLQKIGGERWVAATDFYAGLFGTVMEEDEILTEIRVPPSPPGAGWSFQEVARRHGDYALVGAAGMLTLGDGGTCSEARLAFLSVGDGPVRAAHAESSLTGRPPDADTIAEAARLAARDDVDPPGDIHASPEYKRHLVEVLTRRVLSTAATRAREAAST